MMAYLRLVLVLAVLAGAVGCGPQVATVNAPDGLAIAYDEHGPRSGPALVLVHGWSCDRGYWDGQLPVVVNRWRTLTVDLPGHGDSDAGRETWSFEDYGADLAAFVEQLGLERVIFVGHSVGAYASVEASRLIPERVVGVIGVDTLLNAEFELSQETRDELLASWHKDFDRACDRYVRSLFTENVRPALIREVTADMCATPPELGVALIETYVNYDLQRAFEATDRPIRGINSDERPTNFEGNRRHHPDYDAVIIESAGHFPMLEKPEAFNRALVGTIEGLLEEDAAQEP